MPHGPAKQRGRFVALQAAHLGDGLAAHVHADLPHAHAWLLQHDPRAVHRGGRLRRLLCALLHARDGAGPLPERVLDGHLRIHDLQAEGLDLQAEDRQRALALEDLREVREAGPEVRGESRGQDVEDHAGSCGCCNRQVEVVGEVVALVGLEGLDLGLDAQADLRRQLPDVLARAVVGLERHEVGARLLPVLLEEEAQGRLVDDGRMLRLCRAAGRRGQGGEASDLLGVDVHGALPVVHGQQRGPGGRIPQVPHDLLAQLVEGGAEQVGQRRDELPHLLPDLLEHVKGVEPLGVLLVAKIQIHVKELRSARPEVPEVVVQGAVVVPVIHCHAVVAH
mmetsp:Transcript_63369/g.188810  ORF Transcript_63369/g.188810 Transcript_63369/m.188810 type:complete len:336 (+) Transcript_63369:533-1540(+)